MPGTRHPGSKGGLIFLGILLLIACFFPITNGEEVKLLTPSVFDEGGADDIFKIGLVFLGAAGLAFILVTALVPAPARGIVLTSVGGGMYVILMLMADKIQGSDLAWFFCTLHARELFGYALMLGGTACLFGGSRARHHAPWSLTAAIIGAIGGVLYIGSLVFPGLPRDTMPVEFAINLIDRGRATVLGITLLVAMALGVTASILCLVNWKRDSWKPGRLGNTAYWLGVSGWLVIYAGLMILSLDSVSRGGGKAVIAVISSGVCISLVSLCAILALPIGLSDLLVTTSRKPDEEAARPPALRAERRRPPGPAAVVPATDDVSRRLKRLKNLLAEGLITEEEFEVKRKKLVDEL